MGKKVEFVNLTPHKITVWGEDGGIKAVIPPSGEIARVEVKQEVIGEINGIPVVKTVINPENVKVGDKEFRWFTHPCDNCQYSNSNDCPVWPSDEEGEGGDGFIGVEQCGVQKPYKYFIVSTLVAQTLKGRADVIAPDTSPSGVVRDDKGNIIGVKRFQKF
jgi:hypothetical protein